MNYVTFYFIPKNKENIERNVFLMTFLIDDIKTNRFEDLVEMSLTLMYNFPKELL